MYVKLIWLHLASISLKGVGRLLARSRKSIREFILLSIIILDEFAIVSVIEEMYHNHPHAVSRNKECIAFF